MSVRVVCQCGTTYELKDEFAGRLVKCPQCGRENRVAAATAPAVAGAQVDPAFARDVFLLRQQLLRISEKYDVCDEQGNKIVFVERPAHLLRNLGAALVALIAAAVVAYVFGMFSVLSPGSAFEIVFAVLAMVGFLATLLVVGIALSAKRHVTFYRDPSKREKLLEILQDKKFQPITATYTVRDPLGRVLATLRKNYLFNLFRRRWYVDALGGRRLAVAKEDSLILSLLRRVLGPFFGFLRANFIILRGDGESEEILGEFNRKFTILDRYALDLKADGTRSFDRRIALALGVMLDTGERR